MFYEFTKFSFFIFSVCKWIFPSTKFELTVKQSQFVPIFFCEQNTQKEDEKTVKKETNFKVLWNVCSWPESSWWKLWKCFLCLPESQLTQLNWSLHKAKNSKLKMWVQLARSRAFHTPEKMEFYKNQKKKRFLNLSDYVILIKGRKLQYCAKMQKKRYMYGITWSGGP
jgi:mRNA-degrading endonuclease HigB of HigAB toxin-antitoxin module